MARKFSSVSLSVVMLSVCLLGLSSVAHGDVWVGIDFPHGESSFADAVLQYSPGSYVQAPYMTPENALGIPESTGSTSSRAVSLGNYGSLILSFTDNYLVASGTAAADLAIFEVGDGSENVDVSISQDGITWIDVGRVSAGVGALDIDASPEVIQGVLYPHVMLTDVGNDFYTGPYAGADINAVGAITSVPEPGMLGLLGLGGLAALRRRRAA